MTSNVNLSDYGGLKKYNLAYAYFKTENYSSAVKWFRSYEKISVDSMRLNDAYLRIADCYFMKSEFALAEKYYKNAIEYNFCFPYLYDETQQTAIVYDAACTPDFYVYNSDLELVYRGQLDDSRPGNNLPCDGNDLSHALNCLITNKVNEKLQKPSIGCNIKWKVS